MHYYEVAPTTLIRTDHATFTYSSDAELSIGQLVVVPVGKKSYTGLIMSNSLKPSYDVKPIVDTLDLPPLPKHIIATADWISRYYTTHLAHVLQTILPRGLTTKRRATDIKSVPPPQRNRTKNVFTLAQQSALDTIASMSPGTALLHGVTGSGKTLVYIETAHQAIATGRSAIILVPEIALTSQLVAEFSHHFDDIIVTHSGQTEAQRHTLWLEALRSRTPRIVIGPRSALFIPLADIGLVVVDECHEPSFKQEQSPRYSALRVASTIIQHTQGKLILGSATPSINDYYLASQSGRPIIAMNTPARTDTVRPSITQVDMTKRTQFSQHKFLSDPLLAQLKQTFADGRQALIFHNRRGSASTTLCENCGWQAGCPRCFIPLTLHTDTHQLTCHICGTHSRVPTSCPECHHIDIIHKGIGTKRIEAELARLFPDITLGRFDADTAADQTVERRYQALYDGNVQLIIGTQVIAKGLDLPHLRTVGIIQADAGLSLPDYTASERTFQLLAQVIGRVGRSHHPTNVIVQSYQPTHPAILDGISQNYDDFYQRTLALRRHTNFPPFVHLLKLVCAYKTEATAIKNAKNLATTLRSLTGVEVLGPTPAFYERVRDTYRWQIVVKSTQRSRLIDCLAHLPPKNWQYELDPLSLL